MIKFVIEYLFIFLIGAVLGWLLEVVYRRYFGGARRWSNPGFLSGPYLPLYGSGVVILYIVSEQPIELWVKILIFAVVTTLIEYITGIFFLKFYNTRLWDYSHEKFNIQGIITPKYTVFWTILSLVFYFVLYPYFFQRVEFIYENLELSLFIGVFYGIVIVDMIQSFNLLNRIKKMAAAVSDSKIAINYDRLKEEIRDRFEDISEDISERVDSVSERVESVSEKIESVGEKMEQIKSFRRKPSFMLPFKGDYNMREEVKMHIEKLREESKSLISRRKN